MKEDCKRVCFHSPHPPPALRVKTKSLGNLWRLATWNTTLNYKWTTQAADHVPVFPNTGVTAISHLLSSLVCGPCGPGLGGDGLVRCWPQLQQVVSSPGAAERVSGRHTPCHLFLGWFLSHRLFPHSLVLSHTWLSPATWRPNSKVIWSNGCLVN